MHYIVEGIYFSVHYGVECVEKHTLLIQVSSP